MPRKSFVDCVSTRIHKLYIVLGNATHRYTNRTHKGTHTHGDTQECCVAAKLSKMLLDHPALQLRSCLSQLIDLSADRSLILVEAFPLICFDMILFPLFSLSLIYHLPFLSAFPLAPIHPFSDLQKTATSTNLGEGGLRWD